ncbi:16S rRNA (adenine(1518)-N(6)/adenine(1519)-N(6))-dimethyltransferase RsmA [bacterium]|nr:16S rRNA (adenine(1518)-N(6)/adenine(1519)-N(6))-dimethyltransferase RsmA [bacterium]
MRMQSRPKKKLGQHFLRDGTVAARIIESMNLRANDHVLEIGPGEGVLTDLIAKQSVHRLTAVELDRELIVWLGLRYENNRHVTLVEGDILRQSVRDLARGTMLRVVGNLPYNISSPILFQLLENREFITDATLMVQKEVAERLASAPSSKAYGIPSVLFQLYADIEILFPVPPSAFYPVPAVHSAVIRITFLPKPAWHVEDEQLLKRLVKTAFGQRRKMLRNTLSNSGVLPERIARLRPEQLSVQEWAALTNELYRQHRGTAYGK